MGFHNRAVRLVDTVQEGFLVCVPLGIIEHTVADAHQCFDIFDDIAVSKMVFELLEIFSRRPDERNTVLFEWDEAFKLDPDVRIAACGLAERKRLRGQCEFDDDSY